MNMKVQIFEKKYRLYLSRSTPGTVTLDGAQRLRNKEINAADNTIIGLQPLNPHLTALAVLAGSAVEAGDVGILRMVAPGVFVLDATAYSTVALSSSAPAALGAAASPGLSDAAARSDHVHTFPSAAQVGAEPAITKSLGALVWNGSTWVFDNTAYIPATAVGSAVQAYDADLAAIAALAGNSGLLRKTGANTWSLDTTAYQTQQSVNGLVKSSGTTRSAAVAGTDYVAPGGALGTPSSGNVSGCTMDGANPVGSRNIPMVSQSANYTCVLTDAGRALRHPSADTAARVFTIPSNAAVPYIEGTAITFLNLNGAGPITIAINSDVMRLAGPGTTGSRTLSANGRATAVKVGPTEWQISGVNLT